MSTLLYRFDDPEAFPVLQTESTTCGSVTTFLESRPPGACLRLSWIRAQDDPPEPTIVIGLPFRAIDGSPRQVELTVCGDAGGAGLFIDALDARGWGFAYPLVVLDFTGWRTCAADLCRPSEYWGVHSSATWSGPAPPLQFHHITIRTTRSCKRLDLRFGVLTISGDVRITYPGIA